MHMMAVLEDMPDYDNTDAKTETRAESTSFNDEKNAKWQLPIARRANYEAFRRFDIEEYDIPPSDDFAAMAQVC